MKPIEVLARDICWAEFPIKPKDYTKAAYWRDYVHQDRKAEYIADAEWLLFIIKMLPSLHKCGDAK